MNVHSWSVVLSVVTLLQINKQELVFTCGFLLMGRYIKLHAYATIFKNNKYDFFNDYLLYQLTKGNRRNIDILWGNLSNLEISL